VGHVSGDAVLGIKKDSRFQVFRVRTFVDSSAGFPSFSCDLLSQGRGVLPLEPENGVGDVEGGGKHYARRENLREIDPPCQPKPYAVHGGMTDHI
jgi:hypothetical protein